MTHCEPPGMLFLQSYTSYPRNRMCVYKGSLLSTWLNLEWMNKVPGDNSYLLKYQLTKYRSNSNTWTVKSVHFLQSQQSQLLHACLFKNSYFFNNSESINVSDPPRWKSCFWRGPSDHKVIEDCYDEIISTSCNEEAIRQRNQVI